VQATPGADSAAIDGETLIEHVLELPGGPQLLELARDREDVDLVGGAVRDLLLGRTPLELDVVVAEEPDLFARELASSSGLARGPANAAGPRLTQHDRFGTALVEWDGARVDIAARRAESYPSPGALPEVRSGTVEEDLERRDFTVNAISLALGNRRRGELRAVEHAFADLDAGRLRVLHERSFLDDPTRLLRLWRYAARLHFEPEERTAALAREALRARALATVSGSRIGTELRLALREPDALASVLALEQGGVLGAIDPGLRLAVPEHSVRAALRLLPPDGDRAVLLLAALLLWSGDGHARELLDELDFTAPTRERVSDTVCLAPDLPERLEAATCPSELAAAARGAPAEALALAGALADERGLDAAAEAARRWLGELRNVRLKITGDDLLDAGLTAGPDIGRRLQAVLEMRLDGTVGDSADAQLEAALRASS
jgi:tRNA nucleotidyltransferase (CCA-adding enzyme)